MYIVYLTVLQMEDLSDAAFAMRHQPCEQKERKLAMSFAWPTRRTVRRNSSDAGDVSPSPLSSNAVPHSVLVSSFAGGRNLDRSLSWSMGAGRGRGDSWPSTSLTIASTGDLATGLGLAADGSRAVRTRHSTAAATERRHYEDGWTPRKFPCDELDSLAMTSTNIASHVLPMAAGSKQWCYSKDYDDPGRRS
jgi:hypothetical protein